MKHSICCAEHDEFTPQCDDCVQLAVIAQKWLRDQLRENIGAPISTHSGATVRVCPKCEGDGCRACGYNGQYTTFAEVNSEAS